VAVGPGVEVGAGVEAVVTRLGVGVIVGTGDAVASGACASVGGAAGASVGVAEPEHAANKNKIVAAKVATPKRFRAPVNPSFVFDFPQ
jgi:hypothetical protein